MRGEENRFTQEKRYETDRACLLYTSFKPDNEIIKYPPTLFPTAYTLKNFIKCTQRIDIWVYLKNSFIYSFGATIPSLLVNTMAGYAFARYNFKGKDIIFVIFLATMMIPFQDVYKRQWQRENGVSLIMIMMCLWESAIITVCGKC